MSRIKAPHNLPLLVKNKFIQARSDGDVHYFPTQVTVLPAKNIPFQLRFSPALGSKPKAAPHDPAKPKNVFNPFENPPPAIRIADIGSSHFLVLNKFAIVPEHFILVTSSFKAQTHVLEEVDLEATLACIAVYEAARRKEGERGHRDGELGGGDGLYAFFNCGNHSGASQPHRHIQMLPIARMRDGLDDDTQWSVLAERLTNTSAPFKTFAEKIDLDISSKELHAVYLRLYRQACEAVAAHFGKDSQVGEVTDDGEARISYNMAMTKDTLVILPRLAEGANILGGDGSQLGSLSFNGTVLAGTALAKNELEWEALHKDPKGFEAVLKSIGIPSEEVTRL